MDSGDYFKVVLFVLWLVWQALAAAKKATAKSQPTPPLPTKRERTDIPEIPPPLPVRTGNPAEGAIEALGQLEKESEATLPELDEKVRAQVAFHHERFRNEASALRRELDHKCRRDVGEPRRPPYGKRMLRSRSIATYCRQDACIRRSGPGARFKRPGLIADRLVADFYKPEKADGSLAPPVAIVWDVAGDDRLRSSPLAPSTLFMARAQRSSDPSHWSLFADPLTRYIETQRSRAAPGYLRCARAWIESEAGIGADAAAITRVLFASWLHRILADAVGALFFGPAYLRALARLYARPERAGQCDFHPTQHGWQHPRRASAARPRSRDSAMGRAHGLRLRSCGRPRRVGREPRRTVDARFLGLHVADSGGARSRGSREPHRPIVPSAAPISFWHTARIRARTFRLEHPGTRRARREGWRFRLASAHAAPRERSWPAPSTRPSSLPTPSSRSTRASTIR